VWRDPRNPERAEIAFTVADEWQRKGLATLLFSILWIEGRESGIREYHGTARRRNLAILHWWEGIGGNIRTFGRHHEFSFPLESPDSFLQKVAFEMPPSPERVVLADWLAEWNDLSQV
jgi:GNAT superfamily N-acetyltransferase